jgi:hypothetical protein
MRKITTATPYPTRGPAILPIAAFFVYVASSIVVGPSPVFPVVFSVVFYLTIGFFMDITIYGFIQKNTWRTTLLWIGRFTHVIFAREDDIRKLTVAQALRTLYPNRKPETVATNDTSAATDDDIVK